MQSLTTGALQIWHVWNCWEVSGREHQYTQRNKTVFTTAQVQSTLRGTIGAKYLGTSAAAVLAIEFQLMDSNTLANQSPTKKRHHHCPKTSHPLSLANLQSQTCGRQQVSFILCDQWLV